MTEETKISNLSNDTGGNDFIVPAKIDVQERKFLFKEKIIGISISESDNLQELGYSVAHLKDVMVEVARYILALGGKVAYGGDTRHGGFTELMFDLLVSYKADKSLAPHERFYNYLAFPLYLNLTPEKEAELKLNVSFKKIAPPKDVIIANIKEFLKPDTTENLYVWSKCLTEMRNKMESECDARIFIGGRISSFKGKCPGILEELLIALEHKHPVYLIGAFGGITKDAIDALGNNEVVSFTSDFYLESKEYRDLYDHYNSKQPNNLIDYKQYFNTLQELNFKGLSELNGLTENENKRLAVTPHISEIVFLIVKGLTNRFTL